MYKLMTRERLGPDVGSGRSAWLPWTVWLSVALFLAVPLLGLWLRPILPNGETRYVTVAWNMWLTEDHIVPMLDGFPYSDKPPFLLLAIEEMWDLFGPLESVARLVPPAITAACFALIAVAARLLWPRRQPLAETAPLILLSLVMFAVFGQALMFDGTLTLWVLVGLVGLIGAAQGAVWPGFLLFGVSITMGILTKGPVLLVFTLPAALLYPFWRSPESGAPRLRRWYSGVVLALVFGSLAPLAWALTASQMAGEHFGSQILWQQTAGRLGSSFAHRKPWWFYLVLVPAITLPWFYWSGTWSAALWRRIWGEWQVRMLVISVTAAFLFMTLVSGKRVLYLLPLFPATALLVSRLLVEEKTAGRINVTWIAIAIAGLAIGAVSLGVGKGEVVDLMRTGVAPWLGPALLVVAGLYWLVARGGAVWQPLAFAALSVVLILVSEAAMMRYLEQNSPADILAAIPNSATVPLGVYPRHHGEFGYSARRREPVASLTSANALREWAREHPEGYIIVRMDPEDPTSRTAPARVVPFRMHSYGVWKANRF